MSTRRTTLGDDVLATFERACVEGDLEVAEYLLRALEVMGAREEGRERLELAYLDIAHTFRKRARH